MPKTTSDPLRAALFEITDQIERHTAQIRDFAATPGNTWLAKGELQALMSLLSDLESLLEDIKQAVLDPSIQHRVGRLVDQQRQRREHPHRRRYPKRA